jgi:hypothetical protein
MPVDDFPDDNAPSDINACWLDLTAAHSHVVAAADGLTGPRHARAEQLARQIADALAFTRRLAIVAEGDLRADLH